MNYFKLTICHVVRYGDNTRGCGVLLIKISRTCSVIRFNVMNNSTLVLERYTTFIFK